MALDFINKAYNLEDIPDKKEYILNRLKKIYPTTDEKTFKDILNSLSVCFRKQDEKGASNHLTRSIYVSLNEIKKYNIRNEKDFLDYLNSPKSVVTHETIHLIQNIFEVFPDKNYTYRDKDGDREINYKKYVTDQGEIQSRIEQILELLKWGFNKNEIVQFLYSRKYNDKDLWRDLVDKAIEIKKNSSSKLPGLDDDQNEDEINEQGRTTVEFKGKPDKGKNYEKSYL